MENQKTDLKPLQIIHLAMCLAPAIFLTVVPFLKMNQNNFSEPISGNEPFYFVAPLMALTGFIGGRIIFKKLISTMDAAASLSQKIAKYQTAFIVRQALFEGATLFNVIVYFLLGHFVFAVIATALILFMFTFRPTRFRVAEDLQLNYTDLN